LQPKLYIEPPTPSAYKMNVKLKEEDPFYPLPTMKCWRINKRSHPSVGVNIQIFLMLEGQNHPQGVGHNMIQSLLKLQLS
jgi:hypothetical protein